MTLVYEIGPFRLQPESGALLHQGVPAPLGPRAIGVLTTLVQRANEYVDKEALIRAVWADLVVEEHNLAVQISAIRRVFAGAPGGEHWIETLSRRGYRFVGPVTKLEGGAGQVAGTTRPRSNLPESLTSFIGREQEVAELRKLLADQRLLTLTGAGGVGKTRLAMRIAAAVLDEYSDGVWLVELDALSDPGLVPQAVSTVLDLKEERGKSLTESLTEYLQTKRLLLMLDNAEHLLAPCAQLTDRVLRRCPEVTLLVTSRERLGVPGELTYRVPSLSIPDATHDATARSIAGCESVRLFSERVRLHRPHFALTDQNAPALANICRQLDGIPLAIELAASRVRSMSVEEVNQRLDQRFALLMGAVRTVPRRQQTLRAAIDWSYDLLSDAERALFGRIAVFAGGWTLEAAERVCADDDTDARDFLELLTSLADKSLVVAEERVAATRYRLLESVHHYAIERLHERGEELGSYRRHLAYFLALAEAAEPQLTGKDQRAWLDRLEIEHDNLRAALARSAATGEDAEAGLRLANAFARFWLVRGYLAEGRAWLSKLLAARRGEETATFAKSLNWAGIFAWKQGDFEAAGGLYDQSLAVRRRLGDRRGIAAVLNNQGLLAYEHGDYRGARALHEESLAIERELGDRWGAAVSLVHVGSLASAQGDYSSARSLYEESLAIFRDLGDRGHIANAIRSLGSLCNQQGDYTAARALYEESLATCRELRDRSGIAWSLYGLSVAARHQDDDASARALCEECLGIYRQLGDREGIANALNNLGEIAAAGGDYLTARAQCEESLAIYRELSDRAGIAAAVEGLADIACALGKIDRAACMWGAMERLREEIGTPLAPSRNRHYHRQVAGARSAAGDAPFDLAWQKGRAMALEQAVAYARENTDA